MSFPDDLERELALNPTLLCHGVFGILFLSSGAFDLPVGKTILAYSRPFSPHGVTVEY